MGITIHPFYANTGTQDKSDRTFANDESLPDLPLPQLEDTLNLYLESVKPHVTEQEFLATKNIVEDFERNEGATLHQILVDKSKTHSNWVY